MKNENKQYALVIAQYKQRYILKTEQGTAAGQLKSAVFKCDLVPEEMHTILQTQVEAVAPGVAVHAISSVTGQGLGNLQTYLKPGKAIAFIGSSGVGKSSLVNAIMGGDRGRLVGRVPLAGLCGTAERSRPH